MGDILERSVIPGVRLEYVFLLALDSATEAISAALAEVSDVGVRMLGERVTVDGRAHGELLTPQIDAVLSAAGVKPVDLAAIAAGVGPGPYTGLRVGLVTAAALGAVLGVPTYGVSTLDVIGAATTGHVLVATDARRREVYWAVYRDGLRSGPGPAVGKPADVGPVIAKLGVREGAGDGVARYSGILGVSVGEPRYPPMAHLARLTAGRVLAKAPSEQLTPLYLRRPDAEEKHDPKPTLRTGER